MSFFVNLLDKIDFSTNWLLVLAFLGFGFGYGMALGKNRLNLITFAAYFSLIFSKSIPWKQLSFIGLKNTPDTNVQIFLFLAIILAIFFLAPHSGLASVVRLFGRGRASWWQLLILGVVQLGLLISVIISFLPTKTMADLNPMVKQFFGDPLAQFLWLLAPLVGIMALKKKRTYLGEE